ncbi:uncharacterized protein LOC131253024 isoform X2 [Magnolia sinica]|nr:uncharacterized protein LOC131253024 isoform X2 [Magnolia sinica]
MDASEMAMDSSLLGGIPTKDNLLDFEFRRGSSKQASGAPMKMLLAEEMSKEMECRRRSPSVIAKLMGLDPLPTQQPVHKEQKKFSESYRQRTKSIGYQEKYVSYEDRLSQKSGKEQQEFKDVFEVMETSMVEKAKHNTRMVQKGIASSKLSEAKMAFIRQKFMDAKRLSTDENLRQSKEFHDALEVLDSNKDLFLKFLQEPDSLFTKHLHDLQAVPSSPQSNHVTVMKSSKGTKHENSEICWKSDRKTENHMQLRKDITNPFQKHERRRVSHNTDDVYVSQVSTRFEGKPENCLLPTRIVVLKPSLGRTQSTARAISSPSSSTSSHSSYRKHREFRRSGDRELFPELRDRPKLANNVDLLRHRTRSSREIAREITQQMRQSVSSGSANVSSSGKGYVRDESSYCLSGKDSVNDNEVSTQASGRFRHISSSYSTESFVSREARKRLSERWKMTHRFQEGGSASKGSSTLGEMLALSDRETEPATLASTVNQGGPCNSSSGMDMFERWGNPSGISSRDGWKDAFPRKLPKSRSLPASSTVYGSQKTRSSHDVVSNDNHFMLKEAINLGPDYSFKENFDQKGISCPGNTKVASEESQSHLHADAENSPTIREIHVSPDETKNVFEVRDLSAQQLMVPESSAGCAGDTMPPTDHIPIPECEEVQMDSNTHEEPLPEPADCMMLVKDSKSADWDQNDLIVEETPVKQPQAESHCQVTELESPRSCKGAEQPSPVSVLEPAFEVETSSSECFERVSADLHGLRMQLQLLKLETAEASTEGSDFMVSSDEEPGEGCSSLMEDKGGLSVLFSDVESRDFSFLLDVLGDAGFHEADSEMLFATWNLPELPIGSGTFEVLEKKYGGQVAWPRSERRLLFDLINSALAVVLGQRQDQRPWMKLKGRAGVVWGCRVGLADEVWELLVRHGKEGSGDTAEKALGRDVGWLDLGEDVDVIGREIERVVMDELLEEVVCGLSS